MKWLGSVLRKALIFSALFAVFFFLFVSDWLLNNFGNLTPESMIFHLRMPLRGASDSIVFMFIWHAIIPAVILAAIGLFLYLYSKKRVYHISFLWREAEKVVTLHTDKLFRKIALFILITGLISSFVVAAYRLDLPEYIVLAFTDSDFIERHYVDPRHANIQFPETRRNLIFIYLESAETSFMSVELGGGSATNLIPELTELAQRYVHFSNTDKFGGALQVVGTGWTIAGMFASTAGLPLTLPLDGNAMNRFEYFAPGVFPLGSILQQEGYNQMLIVGSDAEFGGRYSFFTQHGNYMIRDVFTAETDGIISEGRRVWWGFEDMKLYEYAKMQLSYLAALDAPFNLTLLTVDTHHIDGFVCPLCIVYYVRQYNNVIRCGSRQLYDFITWVQAQDFYENTTIVILGDHLSMQPDLPDHLYEGHVRTIYNAIINSAVETENEKNRIFTKMDFFPTTLAAMGVTIEGDRLALGVNLFSNLPTFPEIYGLEKFESELRSRSRFYNSLLFP